MNKGKKNRIFILGLDGASHTLTRKWMDEGRLPNFTTLSQKGAWGELRSTVHPFSAQAWSTFVTGANPGRHGLFDFTEPVEGKYGFRFVDAASRRLPTIWQILSGEGKKVVVMNVPLTYPPEPVNGVMVAGMDAPGTGCKFAWPESEKDKILSAHPDYTIEVSVRDFVRWDREQEFLPHVKKVVETQIEVLKNYLDTLDWDVAIWVCRAPDQAQHFFWKYMDPKHPLHDIQKATALGDTIRDVYEWMDEIAGDLREFVGDETDFLVISDHGQGPTSDKALVLNRWLQSHGLLAYDKSRRSVIARLLDFPTARFCYNLLRKSTPRKIKNVIIDKMPGVRDSIETLMSIDGIDWSRTLAYSEETRANIRINLKGREPQGIVEPGEQYEQLRDRIIHLLADLKDPDTGRPIAETIYKKEQLYDGQYLEKAPDILFLQPEFEPEIMLRTSRGLPGSGAFKHLSKQELEEDVWPNGSHRMTGILFAQGPSFKAGSTPVGAGLQDLAPTLLNILGLKAPSYMDGRTLTEIVNDHKDDSALREAVGASVLTSREKYDAGEIELIEDRLRGLGYIE